MKAYLPIVLLTAAALAGGSVLANDHRGRHGGMADFRDPTQMIERMARHLDLDEIQEQNINNILTAVKPEAEALRERGRESREAMRALDPADPDYSAKLNNLAAEIGELATEATLLFGRVRLEVTQELTAEQAAELAELAEQRRDGFGRRWRNRHAADADAGPEVN